MSGESHLRPRGVVPGAPVGGAHGAMAPLRSTSTPSAPPPLLRCTSTPIVPSYFDLADLVEGEAQLTFGATTGSAATATGGGIGAGDKQRRSADSYSTDDSGHHTAEVGEEEASEDDTPMASFVKPTARALRRSPRGHKGSSSASHASSSSSSRVRRHLSDSCQEDSGLHSLSAFSSGASSLSLENVSDASPSSSASFSRLSGPSLGAVPKKKSPAFRLGEEAPPAVRHHHYLRDRDLISLSSSRSDEALLASKFAAAPLRFTYLPGHFQHREKVDFLKHLSQMGAHILLDRVFSHLEGKDLCAAGAVSTHWRFALTVCAEAARRRKEFLLDRKLNMENLEGSSHSFFGSPRKAMANKTNILPSSPGNSKRNRESAQKAIVSPSKIRHRLFTEEASKLAPGEQLQCCPRCTSPSRVVPSEHRAACTRLSCGFVFCTRCLCAAPSPSDEEGKDPPPPHSCRVRAGGKQNGNNSAGASSSSSKGSGSRVTSKKSRSRLKRL